MKTLAIIAATALVLSAVDANGQANYDEAKIPKYTLPDPLTMLDGSAVTDAGAWRAKRRAEVLSLFKTHMFGAMPPAPGKLHSVMTEQSSKALGGKATRKQFTIRLTDSDTGPAMNVLMYTPNHVKGSAPAFVAYNFNGNHTVHADPAIRKSLVWQRRKGSEPKTPDDNTRGASASRWAVEAIIDRGYALATIYYGDVDPDFHDGFENGIHAHYPKYQNRGDNWTSIGAWAWGLSRVVDYFERDGAIDAKRVAVLGHSRLGKTSLWAGATDERFALVISNNSGCGGAALSRRAFGESVARINTSFPHWFCANYKKYNSNENDCPVDQHMLIALMAPRPVYVASAEQDRWADPRGEFLSCVHATPVYKLFGLTGLPTTEMPPVNQPVVGTVGYHIRTGKHDVTDYDWRQYLAFADRHLKGKQ